MCKSRPFRFIAHLSLMGFSIFVLYFLAVGLADPTASLLKYMNDPNKTHTAIEWAVFIPGSVIATGMVCLLILLGEHAKNKLLEMLKQEH
ncbi:hypothetical protein NYD60_12075 [Burkholderia thailandensis]|uniref:hypothetical protein n=1 Tax=Burkholderia thailandensis TaxID=57975 RepID=UPI00217EF5D2|nr:hypothetical protein [Burkholderia thailandensis]MCS6500753.1 hypothetical protein [Burkholderia thailandensis]